MNGAAEQMSRVDDQNETIGEMRLEFARKVRELRTARGWQQIDLARHADIPRDSISSYEKAKALPKDINLNKLAKALRVTEEDLLPTRFRPMPDVSQLSDFEFRAHPTRAGLVIVHLNKIMTFRAATDIAAIVQSDRIDDVANRG